MPERVPGHARCPPEVSPAPQRAMLTRPSPCRGRIRFDLASASPPGGCTSGPQDGFGLRRLEKNRESRWRALCALRQGERGSQAIEASHGQRAGLHGRVKGGGGRSHLHQSKGHVPHRVSGTDFFVAAGIFAPFARTPTNSDKIIYSTRRSPFAPLRICTPACDVSGA